MRTDRCSLKKLVRTFHLSPTFVLFSDMGLVGDDGVTNLLTVLESSIELIHQGI